MLTLGQNANEQRQLTIKNIGSEKAPPFGIMQVFGLSFDQDADRWKVEAGRPTEDNAKLFVINGATELEANEESSGTWDWPTWVLFDSADGTPGLGEVWGVGKDTFKARKDKRGLIVIPVETGEEDELQVEDITFVMLEYCRP
jgi:hypothetical protein